MFDWLLAPLQYGFMVRGMLAAVIVGVVCAVLGTYVVLRGMAFFGDALAHAVLPGVAVGYLVGGGARGPVFWWAMVAALLSAFGIGAVSQSGRLKQDTAIGIIFAGMFAFGVALISMVRNYTADLTGDLVRPDARRHPPPAHPPPGLPAHQPHRHERRGFPPNSGGDPDGRHAHHAGSHRLAADPQALPYDVDRRRNRGVFGHHRSLPVLLS